MKFAELVNQANFQPEQESPKKRTTPLGDVEESILSGEYAFPTGKIINVIGPDGDSYSAPSEQIKEALENGYRLEAPNEIAKREFRKQYKGLKGDVVVAVGQFADEFLGGLPEVAFDSLSKKDDFDKKEVLKQDHELANLAGGVGGFLASSLWGGPLAKLFSTGTKAGAQASKAVAKSLAARGISQNSAKLGAQVIAKTAENTAKLGVEGLVASAPLAITETALGDPEAGAETLLMGGGLGIGLGIISGPTSVLFSKANKAAKEAIDKKFGEFEKKAADATNPGSGSIVDDVAAQTQADESLLEKIFNGVSKKKQNADEIVAATQRLGGNVLEGQIAADKVIQDLDSALSKKATVVGFKRARQYQDLFDKASQAIKNVFNVGDDELTRYSVGIEAKESIVNSAKQAIDAEGAVFNNLRMDYADIALDKKPMKMVLQNIKEYADLELDAGARAVAKDVAESIEKGRLKNLNDLFTMRTKVREMYNPLPGNDGKNRVILDIIEKLNLQEERTIDRAIKARIDAAKARPGKEALEESMRLQGLYDDMQAAKQRWAELASNLEDAGGALGLGKIKSPRDFVYKADKLKAEDFVRKLLPKDDVAALRKLQQKFPEQFEQVAKLEKAKLLEGITYDEKINPVRFRTQYAKMLKERPEFTDTLFTPQQRQILDDVRTVMESVPENINPSGTAKTLSYMDYLAKEAGFINLTPLVGSNVKDYLYEKAIKKFVNVDDLINTQKSMAEINKKLDKVPKIIKALESVGQAVEKMSSVSSIYATQQLLGDTSAERRQAFEKLKEKLEAAAVSPNFIEDNIVKQSEGYSASAPNITEKYMQKTAGAVGYLYQNLPKPMNQPSPFFKREWKPSDMDLAKFERKLSVAIDPFVVIDALQDNSLTKDHMESLLVNYPMVANALRGRVLEELTKNPVNLPYQTRLKMSLFMGYDVDGTTTPQMIAGFQNSFAMMPEISQNEGEAELNQSGLNKMKPAEPEWTQAQLGLLK